jgi:hypothetical protein
MIEPSDNLLVQLQEAVAARLASDPVLSSITIVTRRKGDITNDLQNALGLAGGFPTQESKVVGLCLFVFPPLPLSANANTGCLYIDDCEIRVQVLEVPTNNQTAWNAELLVARVLARLHGFDPDLVGVNNIYPRDRPVDDVTEADGSQIYDTIFSTSLQLPEEPV